MKGEELLKRIEGVNPKRLDAYHRIFDRVLLFSIAAEILDKEEIEKTIQWTDKLIRKSIEADVASHNNFLYNTPEGRISRLSKEPDGEDMRLQHLKTWELAKDIIRANLLKEES